MYNLIDLVNTYFNNKVKTQKWFYPNFGYISPYEMIRRGKADKVEKFIKQQLELNKCMII